MQAKNTHTTPGNISGISHILHTYTRGETIMPPRVLASGPKSCGGNNKTEIAKMLHTLEEVI